MSRLTRLLFVCTENANRSQMAQAFASALGGAQVHACSAGSKPSGVVNPKAVRYMAELGIDLGGHRSKSISDLQGDFDAVITMGCGDACPYIQASIMEDWALQDPKHLDGDAYRAVRDEIRARVAQLLQRLATLKLDSPAQALHEHQR
jgi:arsenate reductase (thioredoxin)